MWIGDALVIDALSLDDPSTNAHGPLRALWCRDDARVLARVTIVKASRIDELGDGALVVDDDEEEAAAGAARDKNIVPVLGVFSSTGGSAGIARTARIEEDVGDLSLHDVARAFTTGGEAPAGFVQYIERERRVRGHHPPVLEDWRAVVVAWDGTLWWRRRPRFPDWWPVPLDGAASPFLATARGPFDARELAGMLRGLFPDQHRACALEREDRLHTALPARDGSAAWQRTS